jgi:hypothetical protein
MQVPTIHINGTSRERLLEALSDAGEALRKAREALAQTAPNGRDYYPQGLDALRAAEREHWARMEKLFQVQQELEYMAIAICDAEVRR